MMRRDLGDYTLTCMVWLVLTRFVNHKSQRRIHSYMRSGRRYIAPRYHGDHQRVTVTTSETR